jgi:PAS domain S-box-containing protein
MTQKTANQSQGDERQRQLPVLSWIVQSSNDAIVSADLDGIITSWNPAAERMYGHSATEAIGQSIPALIHPQGANEWDEILRKIRNDEAVEPYETVRITKDGRAIPVSLTISPMRDSSGTVVGSSSIAHDLSERMQASQTFHNILNLAPVSMLAVNTSGNIIFVNSLTEELFGYHREEMLGQQVEFLLPEGSKSKHPSLRDEFFAHPHIRPMGPEIETFGRRKDGSEIAVEIGLSTSEAVGGETLAVATIKDVTESKRLLEYAQRMEAIVESSDDAIMGRDLNGIITSWNRAAERICGYSAAEMIGQDASRLVPSENKKEMDSLMEGVRKGEETRNYETARIRKDGTEFPVAVTISPIRDVHGNVIGSSTIARDITERKKAERYVRKMASIIESTDDAIISTDRDGIVTSWNPGAERMYGYSSAEMIGQSVLLRTPANLQDESVQVRDEVLKGEKPRRQYEAVRVRKDGSTFPVSFTVSPLRDATASIVGLLSIGRDISEQRQTELYIRKMASIIESSDDAIISLGLDGIITSWNPGAEHMYGYSAEEMIGQSASLRIPPENIHEFAQIEEKIRNGETLRHYETVRVRKDGSRFPVLFTLSPLRDATGEIIGLSSIGHDITEQKKAERHVRRMASIIESSDDAISSTDLQGIITSWNPGAERMYGYSAEQMIGQSAVLRIPPETRDESVEITAKIRAGETLTGYETIRIKKDGTAFPVSLTLSTIRDAAGEVVGLSSIARDISEQKKNSEYARMLASIVESSDDAINGADLNGIVTHWNEAAERMFGYSAKEIVGESVALIISPENTGELDFSLARIESGRNMENFETKRISKDGRVIPISLTISPIRDADGDIIGSSAIARDISEQKRLTRQLVEANELRNEFVAMVVHDVRSPAASIAGFAQLLIDQWNVIEEARKIEHLKVIARNTEHLAQFVEDVLQVARIEAGGFDFKIAEFDIHALTQKEIRDLAGPYGERSFDLIVEGDIPLVMGDEERQREILMNLLTNAVKFSPADEPITVELSVDEGFIEVAVIDHGGGIAEEDLPKLFQKFGRLAQPGGGKVPGTGLGLYICKTIAEAQGGKIWCESKPGHGSRFAYTIPIAE